MNTPDISTVLGPLAELQADPEVTMIFVDAPDQVYVVRSGDAMGPMVETETVFESPEALAAVIEAVMALGGVSLGPEQTTGQVRLPDGSQVVAVMPPTAVNSPYLVIRKADQAQFTFTWEYLLEIGTLSAEAHELLMVALGAGVNMLVVGNKKQSGKDYIFNLLAESLPAKARVIVVGDAYKIPAARHPHRIHLESGGPANLSTGQLLEIAAKMGPNWLVIGDLSGPEAMPAIQLMNNGYHALATLYAGSPEEALAKVESLCLMANPGLGLAEIRAMIASAFGLMTFQMNHALPDYRIKMTRIVELRGLEHDRYVLQPLFTYDNEQGVLHPTEAGKRWRERLERRLTRA